MAEVIASRSSLVSAMEARDSAAVRQLASLAIEENSKDLRNLVDAAIYLRYSDANLSEAILRYIIEVDPSDPYGHYELAVACLLKGDHIEGLRVLEELLENRPEDSRAICLHARFLCGIGAHDIAQNRLRHARGLVPSSESILIEQFADYMGRLPCQKAIYLAARRPLQNVNAVKSRILDALKTRSPLSLIRFGDGEGVFVQTSPEEETAYSHLYDHVRRDRARVWFGEDLDVTFSGFLPQALRITDVFDNCDIAGVPYRSWIEHEYRILSYSGIVGLGNLARHIGSAASLPTLASQLVHIDLAQSGALREILTGLGNCGVISCFPEAEPLLKTQFGIKEVEFIKVPGERLFADKIGATAAYGRHYPDVFKDVMSFLDRPLNGQLFVVAAGILGKFYCDRIKRSGGIALDLGSLIDAALGVDSRPGYSGKKQAL